MHRQLPTRFLRGALVPLSLVLLTACGAQSNIVGGLPAATPTTSASPTATLLPTCANQLPGAQPINLGPNFVYPISFPTGTVAATPQQTAGGTGLFTVYAFDGCSPNTSDSGFITFMQGALTNIQHSWISTTQFPADGGLMSDCNGEPCFWNPKGGPIYYITFGKITYKGNNVVTWHARYAVFDPNMIPTCNANFANSPINGFQYFVNGYTPPLPLPPLTLIVPDDAAGTTGMDLCSPGTAASVSAFMTKDLTTEGWLKVASNAKCVFTGECWMGGSSVISWQVNDPTSWIIAYHNQ